MHALLRGPSGLAILLVLFLAAVAPGQVKCYVAKDGSDAWSGTLPAPNPDRTDGPFRTLQRARDELRRARRARGRTAGASVRIRGGRYALQAPLTLDAADSGSEAGPVVYQAYRDEAVTLHGGVVVRGFERLTDAGLLRRLPKQAHGKVWSVDLRAAGVADLGSVAARGQRIELFFDGEPMPLARWPNEGFVRIGKVMGKEPFTVHGIQGDRAGVFTYTGDRPGRWSAEPDGWLHGYWFWDWSDSYQRIGSIDPANRLIELRPPHHDYGYRPGQRYYALNLLAELDRPGEWYLDRDSGRLFFWPPGPIESSVAMVSVLPTLIALRGASWVTFRGLDLEACRATAVQIEGGSHNRIRACTIRNTGGWAVRIQGGTDHRVEGCHLHQIGEGGVGLSGGDRHELVPAGHRAADNHIHHFGRLYRTYRPAVGVHGVGQIVEHNLIHDGPHNAIQLGGNDHRIEWNEVHHVCEETGDVGAFYMGRDWTARGTMIRHNYFHHIRGPGLHGAMAVYLDDAASGITVYGNVFFKAGRAMFIGGGRDNVVENNVFIDCTASVHVDARGLHWMRYHVVEGGTLPTRLAAMPYRQPPWSTRYPRLVDILADQPGAPKGNVVARNISVGGKWLDVDKQALPLVTFRDNLVDRDPHFVDRERQDFQLRPDSPAFRLGFKRIPLERIGPR